MIHKFISYENLRNSHMAIVPKSLYNDHFDFNLLKRQRKMVPKLCSNSDQNMKYETSTN